MTARIALIGLSGAGKSTVAPLVAQRLAFRWSDIDLEVERSAGATVATIIEKQGEAAFRELESDALGRVILGGGASTGLVLACGAGILERTENRTRLRENATVVWLAVSPATALLRLEGQEAAKRPLLSGPDPKGRLVQLWEARRSLYEAAADAVVETDQRNPADVAAEIVSIWGRRPEWGASES